MEKLTLGQIAQTTGGRLMGRGLKEEQVEGVCTDSRVVRPGELFIALNGPRYDGHDFVREALEKGAKAALVSRNSFGDRSIRVEDTLKALSDLAFAYRRKFLIPVVGVTGSNGKTTTKDLIAKILAMRFRVRKSEGNLNNLIGLPLSIFGLTHEDEVLVLEMGASRLHEIEKLARIADPLVGVVTNVGPTHLEFLESIENVARAKSELISSLSRGGYAVLNGDDEYCLRMGEETKAIVTTFGLGKSCQVRGEMVEWDERGGRFTVRGAVFRTPLLGPAGVYACLAAMAVGEIFGVEIENMAGPIRVFSPPPMRMERQRAAGVLILNDTYNSNPVSAASSLETLVALRARRRIAVLGDMLELGNEWRELHRELGQRVAGLSIAWLFTVGKGGEEIAEGARRRGKREVKAFADNQQCLKFLARFAEAGDVYLIKGSRGMHMEEIASGMREFLELSEKKSDSSP